MELDRAGGLGVCPQKNFQGHALLMIETARFENNVVFIAYHFAEKETLVFPTFFIELDFK